MLRPASIQWIPSLRPRKMLRLVLLVLPGLLAQQPRLPQVMLGQFVLQTSEGMTDLMSEAGVGWFKRAVSMFSSTGVLLLFLQVLQADDKQ